ncbi:MDR family NADPH-dependent oxidoreductase [Rosistilla oblonga]|uniref:MDR family NADPH-dependent oxidoreductase n=1 Tax=Rosistilla oblonga TaxID=2527990 RepID=UPI003A985481
MKQIRFEKFGPPSQVAKCVMVDAVGEPSAWEVVVDIEAFPINPADLATLAGRYGSLPKLPAAIGMEAVGRVARCGEAVKDLQVGDRVMVTANNNWAQQRKVPAAAVHKLPADGDLHQFALMKVNPATALLLLEHDGQLKPKDWLIQNAPLSSVGRCIMQIARVQGLRTINVVRRPESIDHVKRFGGDVAVVDGPQLEQRVREAIKNQPLRLGLDAVAGTSTSRLAACLSEGGTIVNYGMLSGEECCVGGDQLIFRGIRLEGFWLSKRLNRMTLPQRTALYDAISEMIARKTLQFEVDSSFAMDEIAAALARAEEPGRSGKVIVSVAGQSA